MSTYINTKTAASFFSLLAFLFLAANVMVQPADTGETPQPDKVLGRWVSQAKDSQTEIFKAGDGAYSGTLLAGWGNNLYEKDGKTLRKDTKNPDAALRSQTLLNAVILSGLVYEDGVYKRGTYYDGRTGKTFSCTMKMQGDGLEIRIYWKLPLLGMTKKWTRLPS